jgi:hypothetical protein
VEGLLWFLLIVIPASSVGWDLTTYEFRCTGERWWSDYYSEGKGSR